MAVVLHLGLFDVRTKKTTQKERFKTTNLNVVAYLQCIIKIFSKRQRITLRLLHAMSRPSVCLSVCRLSVCDVGAPYSGG